ncbi:MAG: hypothetical protein ACR2M1_17775 [Gemmatimonadaceae bacterium]
MLTLEQSGQEQPPDPFGVIPIGGLNALPIAYHSMEVHVPVETAVLRLLRQPDTRPSFITD